MEKQNVKVLSGIAIVLGALIVCGLGYDAYEKHQWMKRHAQKECEKAESVRNWTGSGTPHLNAMKDSLDKAEKILAENGDLREVGRLLAQSNRDYAKAFAAGEPEGVREFLVRKYYELNDVWVEKGCVDMQRHPEKWQQRPNRDEVRRETKLSKRDHARIAFDVMMMQNPPPMLAQLEAESVDREIASSRRKFACEQKMRRISDETQDYAMARINDMSPAQYRTAKKCLDYTQISPRNTYLGGRQGDPTLHHDSSGDVHEIDTYGNKWLLKNGRRIAER